MLNSIKKSFSFFFFYTFRLLFCCFHFSINYEGVIDSFKIKKHYHNADIGTCLLWYNNDFALFMLMLLRFIWKSIDCNETNGKTLVCHKYNNEKVISIRKHKDLTLMIIIMMMKKTIIKISFDLIFSQLQYLNYWKVQRLDVVAFLKWKWKK